MSSNNGEKLYCYNHPSRETLLRCNQCERPICTSCAVLTPTGYRCKECVHGQQKKFDTTQWWDYPVAVVVAGVLAAIGSYFVSMLGIFSILLAPVVGVAIAEAVRFCVRRRRSLHLLLATAVAVLVGGLLPTLVKIIASYLYFSLAGQAGQAVLSILLSALWPAVYAILAASSAFYRLKGIRI